jgi:hypothetical protein
MENTPMNALLSLRDEAMSRYEGGMYEEARLVYEETFSLIHRHLQDGRKHPVELVEQDKRSSPLYSRGHRSNNLVRESFMFSHPLKCPENASLSFDQFAFVTLYNLALSTHVAAIMSKNRQMLQKSLELWDLVYCLQWREELNLQSVHSVAILHNIGHAHKLLGNEAHSKKCYQNIVTALTLMREREEELNYSTFFMSAAQRVLSPPRAAPAA